MWLGGLGVALQTALGARYHADFGLSFENGLLSADVDALRARGIDVDSLAAALARQAGAVNGVGRVFTPAALAAASAGDPEAGLWKRLLPPGYGWLLCATTKPGYVWSGGGTSAEHGAGDSDDVSVPVAFWGAGIPAQRLERAVRTVDIGPTLAALLGVRPTERVDGEVLREVLRNVADH